MPIWRAMSLMLGTMASRRSAASCTSRLNISRCATCSGVRGLCTAVGRDRMHHFPFHM